MLSEYDRLMVQIRSAAAETFNGEDFQRRVLGESDALHPMVSGSLRHLSGYDPVISRNVDVTEQYALVLDEDDEPTPWHGLRVVWGSDEEEVTIDLDTGALEDGEDDVIDDERAIITAKHILYVIGVVRPETVPEQPENDTRPLQAFVDFADQFWPDSGSAFFTAAASHDRVVASMVRRLAKGDEFQDSNYELFQQYIAEKYEITAAEVDLAVDMRMSRYLQRREKRLKTRPQPDC
jgi:hypothetical protein